MKQIGSASAKVSKEDYDTWPIFKEFRKQNYFSTHIAMCSAPKLRLGAFPQN